jgi:flagellar hook-associated protein 1 FlgK
MGAGDFLSIGISGLLGSQAAIATTSHNIANVNTEGYSRQTVDFGTNIPNFFGGSFIGTGIVTNNVQRIFDSLAQLDLRSTITNFNNLETYVFQADRIDSIVADPTTGLSPAIQNFFDAMQAVTDDPGSAASRQALFSQTDLLVDRFKLLNNQLNNQRISINGELASASAQITTLGGAIADINQDIVQALGASASGALPNDLLDKRELLISELSKLTKVSTVEQTDGAISVFIGNGQTLVIGQISNQLIAEKDPADPLNDRLAIIQSGTSIPVTNLIVGGKLGGLLDYRNEILNPAINRLGLVSLGFTSSINEQHKLGMDQNDALGGDFFTDINTTAAQLSRVAANSDNVSAAQVSMSITDVNSLSVDNYTLTHSGGGVYSLINLTDDTVITSPVIAPPDTWSPVNAAGNSLGFTLNINANGTAGDNYLLTPTRPAVDQFSKGLNDLTQIAVASPIRAEAYLGNTGSAEITATDVTDTSTSQFTTTSGVLSPPIRIVFNDPPNTFSVYADPGAPPAVLGAPLATSAYNPNVENSMLSGLGYGYDITIAGSAVAGDQFTVGYNNGGLGDNTNGLAMAQIQSSKILNNGTTTLQQGYGLLVSEVGTRTYEAKISLGAAQSLLRQTEARVESIVGVNLDEEAAKLIKFQQSYQASAQIIQTAQLLFDTLIQAVR